MLGMSSVGLRGPLALGQPIVSPLTQSTSLVLTQSSTDVQIGEEGEDAAPKLVEPRGEKRLWAMEEDEELDVADIESQESWRDVSQKAGLQNWRHRRTTDIRSSQRPEKRQKREHGSSTAGFEHDEVIQAQTVPPISSPATIKPSSLLAQSVVQEVAKVIEEDSFTEAITRRKRKRSLARSAPVAHLEGRVTRSQATSRTKFYTRGDHGETMLTEVWWRKARAKMGAR